MSRRSLPGFSGCQRGATLIAAFLALAVLASVAGAQDVGTVIAVEGTAEIGRAATWTPATIGAVVQRRDELRTARPGGRMTVVLSDDSVLNMGEGSDLRVEEFAFEPARGVARVLVRLLSGKIRPLVGGIYKQVGGTYEIETATAIAGVRGTEFVVAYDPVAEVSEVVGVTGQVEVHSVRDRVGRGVLVTTQQLTTVAKGKLPTTPQQLPDKLFRQYLDGLQFIGGGQTAQHPLLAGAQVPPADRAAALPGAEPSMVAPPPAVHPPLWPLMAVAPGDDLLGGGCKTVGGCAGQPPATVRTTGDIGINF